MFKIETTSDILKEYLNDTIVINNNLLDIIKNKGIIKFELKYSNECSNEKNKKLHINYLVANILKDFQKLIYDIALISRTENFKKLTDEEREALKIDFIIEECCVYILDEKGVEKILQFVKDYKLKIIFLVLFSIVLDKGIPALTNIYNGKIQANSAIEVAKIQAGSAIEVAKIEVETALKQSCIEKASKENKEYCDAFFEKSNEYKKNTVKNIKNFSSKISYQGVEYNTNDNLKKIEEYNRDNGQTPIPEAYIVDIIITAPVTENLKKGKHRWGGHVGNIPISFEMRDLEFQNEIGIRYHFKEDIEPDIIKVLLVTEFKYDGDIKTRFVKDVYKFNDIEIKDVPNDIEIKEIINNTIKEKNLNNNQDDSTQMDLFPLPDPEKP